MRVLGVARLYHGMAACQNFGEEVEVSAIRVSTNVLDSASLSLSQTHWVAWYNSHTGRPDVASGVILEVALEAALLP